MSIDVDMMIQTIRKRPGMFLGSEEITPLWHYLHGYQYAEYDSNGGVCIVRSVVPLDLHYFSDYINIKTKGSDSRGWVTSLREYCNGDEHKALECFFKFYDDFRTVKAEYYIKSVLTEENISCHNNMEHGCRVINFRKEPMYPDPVSVYIVKLDVPAYFVLVETKKNIICERRLYTSVEMAIKDSGLKCFGELRFGDKITGSAEFEKELIIR